jgi:hypothetical protein
MALEPQVREAYFDYAPPFDVAAVVRDLLSYVPPEYLKGLKYILLVNASGLSRREAKRKTRARGEKYSLGDCLGLYQRQSAGEPAHIRIHVDRVLQQAPRLALSISLIRDSLFAMTLYHEIGHHIHQVLRPEYREPEDIAENWVGRLWDLLKQGKYHCLTPEKWQQFMRVGMKIGPRQVKQSGAQHPTPTTQHPRHLIAPAPGTPPPPPETSPAPPRTPPPKDSRQP